MLCSRFSRYGDSPNPIGVIPTTCWMGTANKALCCYFVLCIQAPMRVFYKTQLKSPTHEDTHIGGLLDAP